jgi:hypothetical protein
MKGVMAFAVPDQFVVEFSRLLHWFDESHPGCTLQTITDAALPADPLKLRNTFAEFAPGFPVVDPRRLIAILVKDVQEVTRDDSD